MTDHIATRTTPETLVEGHRLDQPTFHTLYQAMPPGTRAELIDGVVHLPSPVGLDHGEARVPVIVWLSYYAEKTTGVRAMDNATTILGRKSEPQPDGLLRILPEFGGRTWNEGGFVHGAPELVVEIAKATRYADFGPELDDYQRAGVTEYVILAFEPNEICWFSLDQGTLMQRTIGDGGLYRSTVFPGLWLDPVPLLNGDTQRLRAVVDLGCATADHTAFVARLTGARRQS